MKTYKRILTTAALAATLGLAILTTCGDDSPEKTPVTPPVTPPDVPGAGTDSTFGAPSNVTATATSPNSITVNWSPVFEAVAYYIFTSRSATGNYSRLDTTTATSYTHSNLSPNTTYYYKIYASNGTDVSNESAAASATTQPSGTIIGGTFTDTRDGKKYKTVEMPDGKTWLAENLNYKPSTGNSWCYDNKDSNCDIYGRLYDWATAMNISSFYNSTEWGGSDVGHQGVCPTGWHLPSRGEWEEMVGAVGEDAGTKLKATTGWNLSPNPDDPIGTDDFGFTALPGGQREYYGNFNGVGYEILWWATTLGEEYDDLSTSYNAYVGYASSYVQVSNGTDRRIGSSTRCIQN